MTTAWQYAEGVAPYRVTAYERMDRGGVVWFRWRVTNRAGARNWRNVRSDPPLTLRTHGNRLIAARCDEAIRQCREIVARLQREHPESAPPALLTIGETWTILSDPRTGVYPVDTAHTREVKRALRDAGRHWGKDKPWASVTRSDLTALWRARMAEIRRQGLGPGYGGAEITVRRLLTVARWLREEKHIPEGACVAPDKWKRKLYEDWAKLYGEGQEPEPKRLRHTLDEMRAILEVAPKVDPRFALLMALGAELRLGQVLRARRSDLDLEHWTLTVRARGKKRGTVVELTRGQQAAVMTALDGHLYLLESSVPDYPLFPGGKLRHGRATAEMATAAPVDRGTVNDWFRKAERLAGIAHVPGRSAYGVRRQAVDAAKLFKVSREGLQSLGGWTDPTVPDTIYAEQNADYARAEAAQVRAKIRGET